MRVGKGPLRFFDGGSGLGFWGLMIVVHCMFRLCSLRLLQGNKSLSKRWVLFILQL